MSRYSSTYAPLWCKSNFSFLEGASHPDELVEEAARLGLRSIALTDRDGVYGLVRGFVKARELGIHLISGAQITTEDGSPIVLLACDRAGYAVQVLRQIDCRSHHCIITSRCRSVRCAVIPR